MSDDLAMLSFALAGFWLLPWAATGVAVRFGRKVENYRGAQVSLGLGWAWIAWAAAYLAASAAEGASLPQGAAAAGLVGGAAVLGWVDDTLGTGNERGLAGHLRALREGRVTTGLLKMAGIAALSLWAAWALQPAEAGTGERLAGWLLSACVIAAAANLLNLLDLRPGRALKVYGLVAIPCAVLEVAAGGLQAVGSWFAVTIVLAMAGPALACLPADLGERAMLGDMGANAAGALAGWLLASVLPVPGLAVAAVVLVALNLASERVSFSAVIERNAVLRWLDRLGRGRGVRIGDRTDEETGT